MKKWGFETQMAQVSNGMVIKIGCKLFVADIDEIPLLQEYYEGGIPTGFKKLVGDISTHHSSDEGPEEAGVGVIASDVPAWMSSSPTFVKKLTLMAGIYKAVNGWVVDTPCGTFIAKKKEELLTHLLG